MYIFCIWYVAGIRDLCNILHISSYEFLLDTDEVVGLNLIVAAMPKMKKVIRAIIQTHQLLTKKVAKTTLRRKHTT